MLLRNRIIKLRSATFFAEGDAKRDQENWVAAACAYRSGLELRPDHFPIWVQLGHVLKQAGDLSDAEEAYCKAIDLAPDNADLNLHLAHLRSRLAELDVLRPRPAAPDQCASNDDVPTGIDQETPVVAGIEPVQRSAEHAAEFFRVADVNRDRGDWSEAAVTYEKGLALAPGSFGMWVQLGNMLKEAGHPREAEAAYDRAMSLDVRDPDLHIQLGHLHAIVGDVQKASASYAQAVGLGSRDRHALHFLARQPGQERIVRETIARLLPTERMRWRALKAQADSSVFSYFIVGLVVE